MFIKPMPEAIENGDWKISNSDKAEVNIDERVLAEVNIDERVLNVPFGSDDRSVALRNHEYYHIKWSPKNELLTNLAENNNALGLAIRNIEDMRVNRLGELQGLCSADVLTEDSELMALLENTLKNPFEMATVYLAVYGYKGEKKAREIFKRTLSPLGIVPLLDEIQENVLADLTFDTVVAQATRLVEAFESNEEQDENTTDKSTESDEQSDESEEGDENEDCEGSGGSGSSDKSDSEESENSDKSENAENSDEDSDKETEESDEDSDESDSDSNQSDENAEQSEETDEESKQSESDKSVEDVQVEDAQENDEASKQAKAMKEALEDTNQTHPQGQRMQSMSETATASVMKGAKNGVSGKMVISPLKLTVKMQESIEKGNRASDFGTTFRYVERYCSDKRMFPLKGRYNKKMVGTILVDISGSMGIQLEDLKEIMKHCRGVQVATYCGRSSNDLGYYRDTDYYDDTDEEYDYGIGKLQIVVKDGRMVEKIEQFGGDNVIDTHAIKWLSKQKAPRLLVCDAYYTGSDASMHDNLTAECEEIQDKFRIKRLHNLNALKKELELDKKEKAEKKAGRRR